MLKLIVVVTAIFLCACPGKVKEALHVEAAPGYEEATKSAIKQITGYVGCRFLLIKSGDEVHPDIVLTDDHSLESPWPHPPNINTKACIVAIKIKTALGLKNLSTCKDPATDEQNYIRVRDDDARVLKERFCK